MFKLKIALLCVFFVIAQIFTSGIAASTFDIRVSKALGSKGYEKIRLSVISASNSSVDVSSPSFTYSNKFKYRWTDNVLSTGVMDIVPGVPNTYKIGGQDVVLSIPAAGSGVRGMIIADPCISSEYISCLYQDQFQMFTRLTGLLNAMNSHDDVHYWQILGDNFYDQIGVSTNNFFSALTMETKSKVMLAVPGNHDFWVKGAPSKWTQADQQGNGFMQWYGQDVIASTSTSPYDFSVDPDASPSSQSIPPASNFFTYNQLGNTVFIAFSGAHTEKSMESYFNEACTWANTVSPDAVLLLGHWNLPGDGCPDSSVPATYKHLMSSDACAPLASKVKYFMGHTHCNKVVEDNVGFMVGGNGMSDSTGCGGEFGVPIVDTTGGTFSVHYFPIARADGFDNYQTVVDCFQSKGVSGCYDLATTWAATPF